MGDLPATFQVPTKILKYEEVHMLQGITQKPKQEIIIISSFISLDQKTTKSYLNSLIEMRGSFSVDRTRTLSR
jgi:hypothetical protein